jgi:prephenate dehydratase
MQNIELLPLISSQNVIDNLKTGQINYGVVAIRNSIGGRVEETYDAIKDENLEVVAEETLAIHHCLFKKNKDVRDEEINLIISHVQALKQTEKSLGFLYPSIKTMEIEDTAIGARKLAEGIYDDKTAVICRKNAGERFGLVLVKEDIEDSKDNRTEFKMFRVR